MSRQRRLEIANETKEILHRKEYSHPTRNDETISIASDLNASCNGTRVLNSKTTNMWMNRNGMKGDMSFPEITVVNATTFAAARDLIHQQRQTMNAESKNNSTSITEPDVCCLNFASAKHPGGGFLKGSQAQEESLARASGLYSCLLQAPTYYQTNKRRKKTEPYPAIYENLIIYSPNVPVFRNDDDELLEDPWKASIITAAAPNRGAVIQNYIRNKNKKEKKMSDSEGTAIVVEEEAFKKVEEIIQETFGVRIDMVLSTAMNYGHRTLVLGAWGCGVFQNDPQKVARLFRTSLMKKCFQGAFDKVCFAVWDSSEGCTTFVDFHKILVSNEKSDEI